MAKKPAAKAANSSKPETSFHDEPVSYKQFPNLAKYIDRIGAEESNFRRFLVKEYRNRGYYIERGVIRLHNDGEISVTNKDHAPTKDEADAIAKEMASAEFPKSIPFTDAQIPLLLKYAKAGNGEGVYFFAIRNGNGVQEFTFAQQRVKDKDTGDKKYLPVTYWSDGRFRRMEPDDGLPFWKPYPPRGDGVGGRKIMIHEGAKTAAFVDALVNDPDRIDAKRAHPFGEVLAEYEHWGMIGGALAPHRAIYEELRREKPAETVYVCDNDYAGIAALKSVSRHWKGQIKGVVFDQKWPKTFDLADEMPKEMFNKNGEWAGPSWYDLLKFATWATELQPNPAGKGRPLPSISYNFREEWWHCVTPAVYIHRDWPANILPEADFNNHISPYSDVEDTARLVKKENASKTAVLSYQPHLPPGIYAADDGNFINTHVGPRIEERKNLPYDAGIFERFLEHLIPEEKDRTELSRWLATIIARPDIKINYGVLLVSEVQGIGKSTLGERILAPIVGHRNVSYPSETEIVDSNFNSWAAHKRLAVVHEIYAGHSAKAYNKLKSLITDKNITVNKKYQAEYQIENWLHMLACSNSPRALQVSMDDRRWLVPRVTDLKKPLAFWAELNDWLENGHGLLQIKRWANEFLKTHEPVARGADAPWTSAKSEMVEDAYSPGMEIVKQVLEAITDMLESDSTTAKAKRAMLEKAGMLKDGAVLIVDKDFQELISLRLYDGRQNDKLERPHTIRRVAKGQPGWYTSKVSLPYKGWGAKHFRGRLISNSVALVERGLDRLPEGLKPLDLSAFNEL
jgi:hypothetical protein